MKILHIGCCAKGYPLNGLQKALIKIGEYGEIYSGHSDLNNLIKQKSDSFKPDIVFMQIQGAGILSEEAVIYLKNNGAFVINWSGDVREPVPQWYYDIGKHIDITSFTNMNDVDTMRAAGLKSEYIDIGYDPEVYTPKGEKTNCQPIVFMANSYDQFPLSEFRKEIVIFLKSNYGNEFGIYGSGWANADGSYMPSQEAEAMAYRSCKIAINCSNFEYRRYSSDRLLRILGTGVFCLCKWFPEIEKDYIDGKHLVVWHDLNELKEKIDYYLAHDFKRKLIAKAGNELVLKTRTYDVMVKNIRKIIKCK